MGKSMFSGFHSPSTGTINWCIFPMVISPEFHQSPIKSRNRLKCTTIMIVSFLESDKEINLHFQLIRRWQSEGKELFLSVTWEMEIMKSCNTQFFSNLIWNIPKIFKLQWKDIYQPTRYDSMASILEKIGISLINSKLFQPLERLFNSNSI